MICTLNFQQASPPLIPLPRLSNVHPLPILPPPGEGAVNPLHPFPLGGNRKGGRVKGVEIDDNQIIYMSHYYIYYNLYNNIYYSTFQPVTLISGSLPFKDALGQVTVRVLDSDGARVK